MYAYSIQFRTSLLLKRKCFSRISIILFILSCEVEQYKGVLDVYIFVLCLLLLSPSQTQNL